MNQLKKLNPASKLLDRKTCQVKSGIQTHFTYKELAGFQTETSCMFSRIKIGNTEKHGNMPRNLKG